MKPDLSNIRNIIFDLGNVLLNLDFDATIRAFYSLGLKEDVLTRQQAYADPVFYLLETGKITPDGFRERIREILENPEASDKGIDQAWSAMILNIPEQRVACLKELANHYNLYLFSNTNKIHIDGLHMKFRKEYGIKFSSLFVKDYYSFEIHERKPDLRAFEKVISLSGINPAESLFIDDLEINVARGKESGMQAFWLQEGMEMADLF